LTGKLKTPKVLNIENKAQRLVWGWSHSEKRRAKKNSQKFSDFSKILFKEKKGSPFDLLL